MQRICRSVLFSFVLLITIGMGSVLGDTMEDGKIAAMHGDYQAAIMHWSKLIDQPDDPRRLEALIRRGEAYRALGYYREAQVDFQTAQTIAQEVGNAMLEAVATQALGQVHSVRGDFEAAARLHQTSLEQALRLQRPALAAASANSLGNVLFHLDRMDEAKAYYEQALTLARQADDPGLMVAARINRARFLQGEQALTELQAAQEVAAAVASPYERAELLLGIAVETDDPELRYQILNEVLNIAEDLDAPRLKSLATGHLATLYEDRGQLARARTLTEQAIQTAQILPANELLLRWEGQLGRLLRKQGDSKAAIDAYRRAIYYFQSTREDISLAYQKGRTSFFQEILAPIYLDLVDLLLQQAATETDTAREQSLLREARDTVERIKISELRDYFRDPCIIAQTEAIEALSPTTAVLYPIILPDRLELLLGIGGELHRTASRVDSTHLTDRVVHLSQQLRKGLSFESEAREIYAWLIQPIIPLLEEQAIDTLVFVPDGPLRLVPVAALRDDQRYLVERYAIVTAPGLTLLDPRPLPRERMQSLLAGLSRPGPVVSKLPNAMLSGLTRAASQRGALQRRGIPVQESDLQTRALPPSMPLERDIDLAEIAEILELPGVKEEINQLSRQLEGEVLLDDEFQLNRFVGEVEDQPYRVVHIASHSFFGGNAIESFILTFDEKLGMSQLADLLRPKQLAERPVELLVLSACQTAEGDIRTPLGLSGVALKSGARSALGSLWPVYDEAAQRLMPIFYTQLNKPGSTKAKALQQAQLDLIRSDRLAHPTFWAPFILVGNWL